MRYSVDAQLPPAPMARQQSNESKACHRERQRSDPD